MRVIRESPKRKMKFQRLEGLKRNEAFFSLSNAISMMMIWILKFALLKLNGWRKRERGEGERKCAQMIGNMSIYEEKVGKTWRDIFLAVLISESLFSSRVIFEQFSKLPYPSLEMILFTEPWTLTFATHILIIQTSLTLHARVFF